MEIKIGVRAHDLSEKQTPEQLAEVVSAYGFENIQLVFNKALNEFSYDEDFVLRVKNNLAEQQNGGFDLQTQINDPFIQQRINALAQKITMS